MATTDATCYSPGNAAKPGGWRFSLGSLFRSMTVCGVAMFAIIQFGPLAAARDVAIGLAIVLALEAWITRSRKLWIAAALVVWIGFIPTILAANAPFSDRSAACVECGMARHTHEVCGWTTMDQVSQTEASRWAASMVPEGHRHLWTTFTSHHRTHWFGMAPISCGGPREGAIIAWPLAHHGEQNRSRASLS